MNIFISSINGDIIRKMRASAPANNNTPPSAHLHLPSYTLKIIMRFIVSRFIPSAEWLFSFSSTKQNKNMKINVELISRLSDNAMRQCAFFFTSFLNGVDDEQSWKCWSSTALLSVRIGFWDATHIMISCWNQTLCYYLNVKTSSGIPYAYFVRRMAIEMREECGP